jgi:putative SOS response-associated peptidase YedK
MCKRLVIPEQQDAEREIRVARPWWRFSVRFNVAVTHRVPVVRLHELELEGVMMRWGFVPSAEERKKSRVGAALVRSDAILDSPDYRKAWLYGQRCVVPLAGYYIWHLTGGVSQPFYVRVVNRSVFGVAALWERTVVDGDDVVESCALLTVPSNPLLAEMDDKSRQMPAILRQQDYQEWFTSAGPRAQALLQPYPCESMLAHPVGPRVNYLKFDDPLLIQPAR